MSRKLAGACRVEWCRVQKNKLGLRFGLLLLVLLLMLLLMLLLGWRACEGALAAGATSPGPSCHQASVYLTSHSCSDGSFCFRFSNVDTDSVVLFKFSFRRLFKSKQKTKTKKKFPKFQTKIQLQYPTPSAPLDGADNSTEMSSLRPELFMYNYRISS